MVDIRQEGHRDQFLRGDTRHTWDGALAAHSGNRAAGTGEVIRRTAHLQECAHQASSRLRCSDLGRAQNVGPTESVLLWSTQEPEPEWLRPEKCMQPSACFRQFPCRATWSLSSVDWESTHAMSRSKPNVAQTLRAFPSYASDICLQCSSLPTAELNKWA